MSRGGRGGRGGGWGGGSGRGKIGGFDTPWEFDAELEKAANVKKDYTSKFPDMRLPVAHHPNRVEKIYVARYRSLRERMHEGPLYTVLGDSAQGGKKPAAVVIDPFEGMRTYSQQFQRPKRRIPRLDTRPFVMQFFPEELRKTLDPHYDDTQPNGDGTTPKGKNKSLQIMKGPGALRLEGAMDSDDIMRDADADDDPDRDPDDDEDRPQEEQDDDFEDDEDDNDDYNAEAYFDDEEGDYDGGDDDDGGGDGDYF